jgi:uncharacterized protein YfaS (alpha-2-macroglobulin family)
MLAMRHPRLARSLASVLLASGFTVACTSAVPIHTIDEAMPADAPPSVLDLWAGVPPLEPLPDDVRMVLEPQPGPDKPKSVSETIEVPFPPEGDPPKVGKVEPVPTELKVERFGPEGEVTLVDAVRLTFNQPMVPLADVESLRAEPIPLEIDPRPPGRVRWLGTRTLVFEPEGRMPFSTSYTVKVPAGVKSTDGKALADAHTWTFSTPKLQLESSSPWTGSTEVELQPTIALSFNQAIERRALVAATTLSGGGKTFELAVVPPRPAMPSDGEEVARLATRAISLVPVKKLEPNTRYTLKIDGGTFGEGPLASDPVTVSFSTYPPLRLSKTPCDGTCWSTNGISLTSTTTLDDPLVESKVHVDPAPADLSITASWYGIQINGDFEGGKTYGVTVDPGLTDSHGQTLGTTFKTKVKLGPPYPSLQLSSYGSNPAVIEKAAAPTIDLKIAGLDYVEVHARALGGDEVESFVDAYSSDGDWGWPTGHAAATYDETITTRASLVKRDQITIDLGKMIAPSKNHAWFIARSNQYKTYGWTERAGVSKLVEITDLGISAALDSDSGVALVTRLSDGSPVSGAKLRLVERGVLSRELWSGTTDSSGFAEIAYASGSAGILHAETTDDHAFLRVDQTDLRGQWTRSYGGEQDQARAFIFTERTPYKPGETIHLSGIVRKETRGPEGGVEMWRAGVSGTYTVTAPRGIEAAKGTLQIGPFGTFSVDIPTDENGGTGYYQFRLEVAGLFSSDSFYHSIPVEEYRAPEFTVEVGRPDSAALLFGDRLVAEVRGNYLHGAPLVGGEVAWSMTRTDTDFRPPGELNDGFTFGVAPTWGGWGYGGYGGGYGRGHFGGEMGWDPGWGYGYGSQQISSGTGTLDNRGVLTIEHLTQEIEPPPPGTPAPPEPADPKKKKEDRPPRAGTYSIQSAVTDKNRQSIAGSASFVVHPAKVYVGLRSQRSVLKEGEQAELEAVLVDLEGERVADGAIAIELVRRETTKKAVEKDGRWTFEYDTTEVASGDCALTSALTPATCNVTVGKPGTYVVRGTAKDKGGHLAKSELTIYVHGKDAVVWEDQERRVDLVPDKKSYRPGDTAKILVRSPFDEARGLVIVEREGIKHEYRVKIEGGAGVVEIPVTETMIPAVTTSAMLVRGRAEVPGAPKGQDLGIPAAATGQVDLKVADDRKRIDVALEAVPEIAPGETLKLTLRTKKSDGTPTKAAVAVMVVDEGVLSLMGYQTPDPITFFHHQRAGQVSMHALHTAVLARDEPPPAGGLGLVGTGRGGGGAGEGTIGLGTIGTIGHGSGAGTGSGYGRGGLDFAQEESRAESAAPPAPSAAPMDDASVARAPAKAKRAASSERNAEKKADEKALLDPSQAMAQEVKLRTVFATTAFFDAEVITDESGTATIEIPMPENLTTFRIMAVAVDPDAPDRFGSGDESVRVRKPLMVRPSLPRFLNYGDAFEGSVMVDNQTGAEQQVLVGTRGFNVELPSEAQKLVTIPAGESREVRFDMKVQAVGVMRLQFAAMSNAGRDATQVSIPVHFPATTEAFADYGMTDASLARVIQPPKDVLPAFGGLELTFSSTALSGLEDAVDYLVTYQYECAEQTASRILPIFALDKILDDFPIASVADRARRDGLAFEGIEKLWKNQLYDGGFGYWSATESWPYLTNWVTFALLEGKKKGHKVDEPKLARALDYIENFVRYGHHTRWGVYYDWTSRAFGLWLLSGEKRGESLFSQVWAHRSEMPLYARAQLMAVAHRFGKTAERDEIMEELKKKVVESARTIHFAESSSEADAEGLRVLMHSSVQTDSIVLMALLEVAPTDPMLSKVMAGIMAERDPRQGGRWATTHANAWALLAASRYYEAVEGEVPDFDANVWLDDQFAGTHAFEGRSMAKTHQRVPMTALLGEDERTLTLHKDGAGKLYYRIGLDYAPADLKMGPEDQGFTVYREYEALPEPGKKEADPEAVKRMDDGSWQVKAGTNVKVTLHIVARDRANYVVIDDALPAGFEGQNPKFVTSVGAAPSASSTPGHDRWWWGWWWSFDHTEMRDDRMLLFSDHMYAGVYEYSYTARATTIGEFHLPPVKAEAMYEPERFGRSGTSVVHIVK